MSDRTETPTPDTAQDVFADAIDALSLLREHGYRIVSEADAAKLDRLRECAVARTADMGGSEYPVGWADGWNAALRTVRGGGEDEQ